MQRARGDCLDLTAIIGVILGDCLGLDLTAINAIIGVILGDCLGLDLTAIIGVIFGDCLSLSMTIKGLNQLAQERINLLRCAVTREVCRDIEALTLLGPEGW